jgi:hypothetical protein
MSIIFISIASAAHAEGWENLSNLTDTKLSASPVSAKIGEKGAKCIFELLYPIKANHNLNSYVYELDENRIAFIVKNPKSGHRFECTSKSFTETINF